MQWLLKELIKNDLRNDLEENEMPRDLIALPLPAVYRSYTCRHDPTILEPITLGQCASGLGALPGDNTRTATDDSILVMQCKTSTIVEILVAGNLLGQDDIKYNIGINKLARRVRVA